MARRAAAAAPPAYLDAVATQRVLLKREAIYHEIQRKCNWKNVNRFSSLCRREVRFGRHLRSQNVQLTHRLLPSWLKEVNHYPARLFCGQFSLDGDVFMVACQDGHIRLYHTGDGWNCFKDIRARNIGWAIIDVDYSSDGRFVLYSTWSNSVQMCNVTGEEVHQPFVLGEPTSRRFCVFSVEFSQDNSKILAGVNDGCAYIVDVETSTRTKVQAHSRDVNSICWADESTSLFATASDDNLCKVWDARLLGSDNLNARPVGVFVGHQAGLTHVASKGDGRYFVTNGKDQAMKLWDARRMIDYRPDMEQPAHREWDYRYDLYRPSLGTTRDTSLNTYRGHSVLETLIRCNFSPIFTTGQRYLYTGCSLGTICVYDLISGECVMQARGHDDTVRDVAWHPYRALMLSSSWDNTCGWWEMHQ